MHLDSFESKVFDYAFIVMNSNSSHFISVSMTSFEHDCFISLNIYQNKSKREVAFLQHLAKYCQLSPHLEANLRPSYGVKAQTAYSQPK